MTKDRVCQLSLNAAVSYIDGTSRTNDESLTEAFESAILAALDEHDSEEPSKEMLIAARDWSAAKYGKPIGNDAAIGCWRAMSAVRRAALQSSKPEG